MAQKVLIIGKVWPEPKSSAAGSRMMELIDVMQNEGWDITFASAASDSKYSVNLDDLGIKKARIELNRSTFDHLIKDLDPDMVLFDRFMTEEQFGWRVAEQCPDALRILDTEDLHCLREARHEAWKSGREFELQDLQNDTAKREIASILRCDLSLIISEFEMKLLKDFFKIDETLLIYLPFLLDEIKNIGVNHWKPYHKRDQFISIGNFLHEPNWNAVLYLKEEIWPLIREDIPEVELHIYGAYSSQKVEQLHNPGEGFMVKGRAESAKEMVGSARVLLAPLRFGAGLKGKLIEAMQCGTPSVTTDIGAEAMHGDFPWPGAIANDPGKFAAEAVELYKDEEKWNAAQESGIQIMDQLYKKMELGEQLIRKIEETRDDLETHRNRNFTGEILRHHTIASTKYLSKWIEAKNRITDL